MTLTLCYRLALKWTENPSRALYVTFFFFFTWTFQNTPKNYCVLAIYQILFSTWPYMDAEEGSYWRGQRKMFSSITLCSLHDAHSQNVWKYRWESGSVELGFKGSNSTRCSKGIGISTLWGMLCLVCQASWTHSCTYSASPILTGSSSCCAPWH